jgi:CelD/BcsL family acetyltransferase involved in cellulose biosynthesis
MQGRSVGVKKLDEAVIGVNGLHPLSDHRWREFLGRHPQASVFHTPEWLEALRRTYGYEPFVVTTVAPGRELRDGVVFCHVRSWLTGHRIVSIPFADHCQPLGESAESLEALLDTLREEQLRAKWKYIELRPLPANAHWEDSRGFGRSAEFNFHRLDLRPDPDSLYRGLHKSCVQRKIQRAEREHLAYEEGRSESILAKFYHLLVMTRRRHRLPPQPRAWFRNLVDCLGEQASIHVASKDGQPIASIFTLSYKQTLVYKYGCSDNRFHKLGGMPWLFWKAILKGKGLGAQEFDLGRSEMDDPGQAAFKGHLGGTCSTLTYFRCPRRVSERSASGWKMQVARNAVGRLPVPLLILAGRLLYRHIG